MIGCAVLPHFHSLVDCIAHGLADEQRKAQQLHPYGIESFDKVLRPLWLSIGQHCGKDLAALDEHDRVQNLGQKFRSLSEVASYGPC
ncbi:hypothetical protein EDD17DRAFT_1532200 [Pisolithus thermaeus]|nr:hypothetical protein EDD17DRAFT_1532200 [Pisolithus thermaeus]